MPEKLYQHSIAVDTRAGFKAIDDFFGVDDCRSRIEQMTEADTPLLPAIDGILPNKIVPIDRPYFLTRRAPHNPLQRGFVLIQRAA
jgi:hypothetical protein